MNTRILSLFLLIAICCRLIAQISPGPLSKFHAKLDTQEGCVKCHTTKQKAMNEGCLSCHKEIKANIALHKGYHASAEVTGKSCYTCHKEHRGRERQIIAINRATFDHKLTGFELKGKHAKQDCKACHNANRIVDLRLKKKPNTLMGLQKECTSCHADFHQGKLGSNCTKCHGFDSFKGAKTVGFDHNTTRFPLIGKHKAVTCVKCHKNQVVNGVAAQRFSGLQFANCTACHKDAHNNRFGQNCKSCHNEESFHNVKGMTSFNHDNTNFKLMGKHQQVGCKSCHKGSYTSPLKHDQCKDCHADYHKKEFEVNGIAPDCGKCHTTKSFNESLFSIDEHKMTKFPLEGAHAATPCFSCHKKTESWTFRIKGANCTDCHKDEHAGFIQDKFLANGNCKACHNISNWKKPQFDHNKTSFKLDGAHNLIACTACHYKKNANGAKTQKFMGLHTKCADCHKDNHGGQFEINGTTDCSRCHTTGSWRKSKFDHNSSRFRLEGAHAKAKCEQCHKLIAYDKGSYVQYKYKSIECSVCHTNR